MSLPVGGSSHQPPYKLRQGGNKTNMDRKTLEDSFKIKIGLIMGWLEHCHDSDDSTFVLVPFSEWRPLLILYKH